MANPVPDRASNPKRKQEYKTIPDRDNPKSGEMHTPSEYQAKYGWVSPWPYGHPNFTHAVSAEQQTENVRKATAPKEPKQEYKTIPDRDHPETGEMHTPSEYQAKYGWVSAWPYGHPNFTHAAKG